MKHEAFARSSYISMTVLKSITKQKYKYYLYIIQSYHLSWNNEISVVPLPIYNKNFKFVKAAEKLLKKSNASVFCITW